MRRSHLFAAVLLLAAALLPSPTRAWSDGQSADLVLGQTDFTGNGTATTQSRMSNPLGVAVDPTTGKVFVADTVNNRVLRFASLASLSNGIDAEAVLGHADFTSNPQPNPVTQSSMTLPYNLTVDGDGRLWVADPWNNRVLRFDNASSKANGANADGVLGQPNFTSSTAPIPPTQSSMSWPTDVAADSSGHLWVAERFNRRVVRFDNAAAKANGANADGVLGEPDFITRAITTTQSGMDNPYGVAVDSAGSLWVVDNSNNRVLRFDNAASKANGANADGVLGQPDFTSRSSGHTQSGLFAPADVVVDGIGRAWVADGNNNRVLRFDNAAAKADGANADGVLGQIDFGSNGTAHTASGMNDPFGLATDSIGNLWVADNGNSRILLFKDAVQAAITRAGSSPTSAASVDFDVTFSSPVTGLSAANFALTASGVSGASISNVAGSGAAWTVTAGTGSGSGTLRLDMVNATGVQDGNSNPVTNVPYTSGESYTITAPPTTDVTTSLSYQPSATGVVTFTLAALNHGPAAADGTLISATFPALTNGGAWHWTCSPSGGATCPATGTGNFNTTLASFPNGGLVTYTAISSSALSPMAWTMTVTATVPLSVTDTTLANNSATVRSYMAALPLLRR